MAGVRKRRGFFELVIPAQGGIQRLSQYVFDVEALIS